MQPASERNRGHHAVSWVLLATVVIFELACLALIAVLVF
jgi:hypothetical protein